MVQWSVVWKLQPCTWRVQVLPVQLKSMHKAGIGANTILSTLLYNSTGNVTNFLALVMRGQSTMALHFLNWNHFGFICKSLICECSWIIRDCSQHFVLVGLIRTRCYNNMINPQQYNSQRFSQILETNCFSKKSIALALESFCFAHWVVPTHPIRMVLLNFVVFFETLLQYVEG